MSGLAPGPNAGWSYREQIGPQAAGRSVLAHLTRSYTHSGPDDWRRRIAAGEVHLDGRRAEPDEVLRAGQWLEWQRPPWREPDVPRAWAVLYRDADLLAVAKPRGLPTVPAGGFLENTLLHLVRRVHPEATPLHRLGRGTSGLVLFARTDLARRALSAAWRDGRVGKRYLALVRGVPRAARFTVDVPIGPVDHPRLGSIHAASAAGRPAVSHVKVVDTRGDAAVVEVEIPTGRPHQIRIHLAAAGHPLVGDPLYAAGGLSSADPALPGEGGYRLHAWRIAFDHPASCEQLEIVCSPPAVLRRSQAANSRPDPAGSKQQT